MASPPKPGLAVPSVLGSHLLLNLRGAYYQPHDVGTLTTRAFELPIVGTTAKMTSTSPVDTQWALYPDRVRRSHINTFAMV
jgi:hypothetical protein